MNKAKLLAVAALAVVAGTLVWWRLSTPQPRRIAAGADAKAPAVPASPHSHASAAPAPAALAKTSSVPDWENRLNRIVNLVGKVPEAELDIEIAELAQSMPFADMLVALNLQLLPDADKMPVLTSLCLQLFERWARRSPAEAAEWLARAPENIFSRTATRDLAAVWAESNLTDALAWLKKLPDNGSKNDAQLMVAGKAADQREAITAIELLSPLPPDPERQRLLEYSALQWSMKDRDSAVAWVKQVPDPVMREAVLGQIAIDWGVTDPPDAAKFVLESVPPGPKQEVAVANIARFWAVNSPEQAAAWVEKFPEGRLRSTALEAVAEVWAKDDSAKASGWLNRLPAGPSRDAAVGIFASTVAPKSPEQAARWAATIQDQTLRAQVQSGLGQP